MTMSVNDVPPQGWDMKRETEVEDDKSASNTVADSKKKRSWKKPKDKPMRPLSAYNMFFQNQRERIVAGKTGDPTPEEIKQSVMKMLTSKTRGPKRRQDRVIHGQISFGDLARTIAAKWKAIDPELKAIYNHYAAQEKVRYRKEVVIWKEKKEREHDAARAAKQRNLLNSSSSYNNDSMMSLSSSVTSTLSTSMSTNYNLSESHNSIQGGLGMQAPDVDVVQRQQDILRQQMGFIDSKPQARMDGNDNVSRELPKLGSNESGDMQFPRSMGGNGNADDMPMNMNFNMNMNRNNQLHKEQLLLQLQQQQLQLLQHLQQVRNETSRLSNMKTTDTFMNMTSLRGNSNSSQPKHLMEQYRQLEDISAELDRLKEQQRLTQQKIQEHQNQTSNGFWQENASFGSMSNNGPNYNAYTTGLNDFRFGYASRQSSFDLEERQHSVRRSMSGDMDLFRGRDSGLNQMNGGDSLSMQRRLNFANVIGGFNSAPNSFNYGKKFGADGLHGMMGGGNHQQEQPGENHGRRDSLAALLHIDDVRDQQRQNQPPMQDNESQQDLGSLFNNANV